MLIGGNYHHPTFLYESIWCLIGFIILLLLKRKKKLKIGTLTSFYLIWYGIERFFVEGLRTDSLMLGPIKIAQIMSILFVLSGIMVAIYCFKKQKKLYKEENYGA